MKKNFVLSAFSLMEMMIVLLIVAIIAAASAPMIAKKMMRQTGTGDSPWVFTGTNNSIAFNMRNRDTDTVYIGTNNSANVWDGQTDSMPHPPLCIQNRVSVNNVGGNNVIQGEPTSISFGNNNSVVGHLGIIPDINGDTGSVFFSNIIPDRRCVLFGGNIQYENYRDIGAGAPANFRMSRKIIFGKDITNRDCERNAVNNNQGGVFSNDTILGNNLVVRSAITDQRPAWNANLVAGDDIRPTSNAQIHNSVLLGNTIEYIAPGAHPGNILDNIIGIGNSNHIRGSNAIAIGSDLRALDDNAIAIGISNGNVGFGSIAIGRFAGGRVQQMTQASRAITIGYHSQNNHYQENDSIAIGTDAQASAIESIAIGDNSRATGSNSIAIGSRQLDDSGNPIVNTHASATGDNSIAIGSNARATGDNSVAIGVGASANANQIVLGKSVDSPTVIIPGDLEVLGRLRVRINGSMHTLGINESSPNANLSSDIRLKNLGDKFTSGLDEIKKLEFFNYTFKNDEQKLPHVGVIAQDLQKVFPISVSEGADGYLRIRWDEMFYAALNAIKELDQKLVELKTKVVSYFDRVEKLEAQIEEQQKTIDALKAQNAEFKKRLTKIEKKKLKNTKISESEAE